MDGKRKLTRGVFTFLILMVSAGVEPTFDRIGGKGQCWRGVGVGWMERSYMRPRQTLIKNTRQRSDDF